MMRTVTAGLDGSPESLAAAEWAAREARMRGLRLKLVHVREPVPDPMARAPLLGAEPHQHRSERSKTRVPPSEGRRTIPREAAEDLRARHPGVGVTMEQRTGRPAEALLKAADDAEVLVLGTRGLNGMDGFMVGSAGLAVVAHAGRPVVLVRAGEQAADEHLTDSSGVPSAAAPFKPVVLGLDTVGPHDTLIGFAFEAALLRATALRVVHAWNEPPYIAYGLPQDLELNARLAGQEADAVTEVLRPWREKFPDVEIIGDTLSGNAAHHLVDASREASLVVVGRRVRRAAPGAHIGPVTHAVLHHSTAPVAVVPHD
ncbi:MULTISPECIES: universal stress protein [unclassified Streptomyces]|jgi:Universal stress protein UspA and related nucleotide-binding proteins|uniref:universal stress protein n=1 Tax=unclassified Streptomyces TaxID=2593676 RepID=UPI002E254538